MFKFKRKKNQQYHASNVKEELSSNIGEIETQFAVNVNPPHVTLPIAA